ncbi:MAG: hypothetical protein IJM19_08620 [Ruminococcus sp.]|nr:hypothetical protein [Ruminococcus sp.]
MAVVLLFLSFLYPTLHGTGEYSYVKVSTFIFRRVIVYNFLAFAVAKKHEEKACTEYFIYYYALTHAAYVTGTLLLVFIPPLNTAWFSVFANSTSNEKVLGAFGYTFRTGWLGFSGYRLTLGCTLSCIMLCYMFFKGNEKFRLDKKYFAPVFILCFLGNLFYGRSGLVVTVIAVFIELVVWNSRNIMIFVKFTAAAVLMFLIVYMCRDLPVMSDWYIWALKPFENLIETGSFNNKSVDNLQHMFFMPEFDTILFGDGYYTVGGLYYMHTDSGIMRNILFWGILGSFLSYEMTVASMIYLKDLSKILFAIMVASFAFFEYKGDVYYEYASLFLAASFTENYRRKITDDKRYYEYVP